MAKIGIFGGTFNPIHNGHLIVGRDVRRGFSLDIVCLIPAAVPPHKESRDVAKAEYRMEMTRLAVEGDPDFSVSDVELKRSGPSYTIDTIGHFESFLPNDSELFFIVGMDAFLDIETWKSYKDLFQEVPFIVMSRPGSASCGDGRKWKLPCEMISSRVSAKYRFDKEKNAFFHPEKKPVYLFDVTPVDISSTMIRKRIGKGQDIDGLVPDKVKEYIKQKGLYV